VWVDFPVDVYSNGPAHRCRVVDVSLSGMVLELTEDLAVQQRYLFESYAIHAHGTEPLCVAARTLWRRGVIQAARFVALSDYEHTTLGEIVETALRRASDVVRLDLAERRDREFAKRMGLLALSGG
jgi:hypothetical protein